MEENNEKYYTTGEFAKKAGVTIRTIRYYDKKGLLKPTCRGENGYRLYKGKIILEIIKENTDIIKSKEIIESLLS